MCCAPSFRRDGDDGAGMDLRAGDLDEAAGEESDLDGHLFMRPGRSDDLDGVTAADLREKRSHRYCEDVFAPLLDDVNADRSLVEPCCSREAVKRDGDADHRATGSGRVCCRYVADVADPAADAVPIR